MSKVVVGLFQPPRDKWHWERTLLEKAGSIALALEAAHKTMWAGFFWPSACCLNTVLLNAPAIRMALEWDVRVIVGRVQDCQPHAWIESPDSDVIDPTYGMFDNGPALRVLPARLSWLLGHSPEIKLSLEQEERLRRSLRPRSPGNGWSDDCDVMGLFGNWPESVQTI